MPTRRIRRLILVLVVAVVPAVAAAAVAFACGPLTEFSLQPQSGSAGDQVMATGSGLFGTNEIRWDAPDGPLLATPPSPSFAVPITIPADEPGTHMVVAISHHPDGSVLGIAAQPFELIGEPAPPPAIRPLAPAVSNPFAPGSGGGALGTARCSGRPATIRGTAAGEVISGTPARDVIVGLGGRDVISGKGGSDIICGGAGNDKLAGGRGRDRLVGGAGRDRLNGGPGRDACLGGPGRDVAIRC